jgi:hypothetical protein
MCPDAYIYTHAHTRTHTCTNTHIHTCIHKLTNSHAHRDLYNSSMAEQSKERVWAPHCQARNAASLLFCFTQRRLHSLQAHRSGLWLPFWLFGQIVFAFCLYVPAEKFLRFAFFCFATNIGNVLLSKKHKDCKRKRTRTHYTLTYLCASGLCLPAAFTRF